MVFSRRKNENIRGKKSSPGGYFRRREQDRVVNATDQSGVKGKEKVPKRRSPSNSKQKQCNAGANNAPDNRGGGGGGPGETASSWPGGTVGITTSCSLDLADREKTGKSRFLKRKRGRTVFCGWRKEFFGFGQAKLDLVWGTGTKGKRKGKTSPGKKTHTCLGDYERETNS